MKKALLILLTLTMVMSCMAIAPLGVAAEDEVVIGAVAADYKPEGTAIKTAAEFAAMSADGTYYLANDITIDKTYTANFTGVFDGNGKTITTSVPVFMELNGTVKNLTTAGNMVSDGTLGYNSNCVSESKPELNYVAGVACAAGTTASANFINVCNKVTITSDLSGKGGICGIVAPNATEELGIMVTFQDCANYGALIGTHDSRTDCDNGGILAFLGAKAANLCAEFVNCYNYGTINAGGRPGGIGGYIRSSANFTNCYNAAEIQSTANYCGGIAGRCGTDGGHNNYTFIDCVNDGDVSVFSAQGAGFVGYSGAADSYVFKNCVNNGDIYANSSKATTNNIDLAGFIGNMRQSGSDFVDTIYFENCVNNGKIGDMDHTSTQDSNALYLGGFVTKVCVEESFKMVNCINNGDVVGMTGNTGYSGGMVSLIAFMTADNEGASFVNCLNTGYIYADDRAAGLIGSTGDKNGSKDSEKGSGSGLITVVGCGNTGDIEARQAHAAGIAGYVFGSATQGIDIAESFNTGNIIGGNGGSGYASGMVAYTNDGCAYTNIVNSYVAGSVTSSKPITVVETGKDVSVAAKTPCSFTAADGSTLYFLAPAAGTVNIANDVVTFTANSAISFAATDIKSGATVAATKNYTTTASDGTVWVIRTCAQAGTIVINEKKNGEDIVITASVGQEILAPVAFDNVTDNKALVLQTYSTPVNGATAFIWNDKYNQDLSTNIVLADEEAIALHYIMGVAATWQGFLVDNSVPTATADEFKSGAVAYRLNEEIGEDVFRQNLNETIFIKDAYPTTDATHAIVGYDGESYYNPMYEINSDVTPPTGDATVYVVIALAVSTISLAALAVVKKRKEN